MKYIITGQEGLIGRELKKRIELDGYKCALEIDKRKGENVINIIDHHPTDADIFFHLASNCKINKTIENPHLAFENVQGIYESLEFCRINKIKKFVNFSSTRVLYPERNPYVASKIYGEELVKAYYECYGIEYLIIRPSAVYGGEDKTHRLIDIWITNAKENKPLIIYGNKDKTLDFTYIDDFLDAIEIALRGKWNQEHNISGKLEIKLIEVAEEIVKQTKSKSEIIFEEPELAQPQNSHIKNTIIYNPKVDIKEGIGRCLKYNKNKTKNQK